MGGKAQPFDRDLPASFPLQAAGSKESSARFPRFVRRIGKHFSHRGKATTSTYDHPVLVSIIGCVASDTKELLYIPMKKPPLPRVLLRAPISLPLLWRDLGRLGLGSINTLGTWNLRCLPDSFMAI